MLLRAGARIDIPNAKGETATTLILQRLSTQDPEIQPLVLNCRLLGLALSGTNANSRQNRETPHSINGPTLFAQSSQAGGALGVQNLMPQQQAKFG